MALRQPLLSAMHTGEQGLAQAGPFTQGERHVLALPDPLVA